MQGDDNGLSEVLEMNLHWDVNLLDSVNNVASMCVGEHELDGYVDFGC